MTDDITTRRRLSSRAYVNWVCGAREVCRDREGERVRVSLIKLPTTNEIYGFFATRLAEHRAYANANWLSEPTFYYRPTWNSFDRQEFFSIWRDRNSMVGWKIAINYEADAGDTKLRW